MSDFDITRVDLTDEEYYGSYAHWMTSTKLRSFKSCPYLFDLERRGLGPARKHNPEFVIGSAVHANVLEGSSVFSKRFTIDDGPINPTSKKPYGRQSKAWLEWSLKLGTENVINNDELSLVFDITQSVKEHDEVAKIMSSGEPEVAFRGKLWGVDVQAKIDWFDEANGIVMDLKTCRTLRNFEHDFYSSYNLQAAFYNKVCSVYSDKPFKFYFVAVEKTFPYLTAVYRIEESTMDNSLANLATTFGFYNQCREKNDWPKMTEAMRLL